MQRYSRDYYWRIYKNLDIAGALYMSLMLRKILTVSLLFIVQMGHASITDGVNWLSSEANIDGSYAIDTDVSTAYQATAETLRTLQATGNGNDPSIPAALSYLSNEPFHSTEYLSRQIISQFEAGNAVTALVDELLVHQNRDGGFGELPGFDSTALDTSFALEALGKAGTVNSQQAGLAISYLLSQQNADGSWSLEDNEPELSVTAQALISLQAYIFTFDVSGSVQSSRDYLLAQQTTSGDWGNDRDTAKSLLAILPVTSDATVFADAITILTNNQNIDGSWGGDVYTTALATRALFTTENITLPTDPSVGIVSGRVINDQTGLPLTGVLVSLQGSALQTTTEADGDFVIAAITPASYTVSYQVAGFTSATQTVSVVAGLQSNLGTIRLAPLANTGIVSGLITGANDSLPLAGVLVQIANNGSIVSSALTSASGSFALATSPGDITVTASLTGYDTASGTATLAAGATLTFSPALNLLGTTPTDQSVTVTGTVVRSDTGVAIPQASIAVVNQGLTTNSDSNGLFSIASVTAGELVIDVSATGFQTVRYSAVAPAASTIDLGTVRLSPASIVSSTVSGIVTDAVTGDPLQGVNVTIESQGQGAITAADGSYLIENISGTQFAVVASSIGYLTSKAQVSLTQPSTVVSNFALQQATVSDFEITNLRLHGGITNYAAISEVELELDLTNRGTSSITTQLFIKAINADGIIVDQRPAFIGGDIHNSIIAVGAAATTPIEIEWDTDRLAPGEYQLVVQAFSIDTNQLLAERGIGITIDPTNRIGGLVEFDPPIAQLAANRPIEIAAEVSNRGNLVIPATTVTATVALKNSSPQQRRDLFELSIFTQDERLDSTQGMDVDSAGNIYTATSNSNTVHKISPNGIVTEFATGFLRPIDIDIDQEDNVYVLNTNTSFVRITPDGDRTVVQTGLNTQNGIEILPDGRVLIIRAKSLHEVLLDGTVTQLVGAGLANPKAMVVNSLGDIFIVNANDNSIARFSNGNITTFVTGISRPSGIAIDAADNLYVTSFSSNTLVKVTTDGGLSTIATGLSGPTDIKITTDNNFIVINSNAHQILSITPAGQVTVLAGPTINIPNSAKYDASGNLYVGNSRFRDIRRIERQNIPSEVISSGVVARDFILEADGSLLILENSRLVRQAPNGFKTAITSGLASTFALLKAPDGNGHLVTDFVGIKRITESEVASYAGPQFSNPYVMRTDAAGNQFILSTNGYATKIDPNGKVSRIIDGLRNNPRGLAIDAIGNVYINNFAEREIIKVDPVGNATVLLNTTFSPGALAIAPTGELLIAEWRGRKVYKLEADSTLSIYAELQTYAIDNDMQVDAQGNLWAISSNFRRIVKVTPGGIQTSFAVTSLPRGLLFDDQGGAYFVTSGAVRHIDSTGNMSEIIIGGVLSSQQLAGISFDTQNRFLVLATDGTIYRFNLDKTLDKRFASLSSPRGMIAAPNDSLVVVNGNSKILRVIAADELHEVIADGAYSHLVKESDSTALISNASSVKRLNIDTGQITNLVSGFSGIGALAVAPDGGFVVGDSAATKNELVFFNNSGVELDRFTGLVSPRNVLVDSSGNILVSNTVPNNISVVAENNGKIKPFSAVTNVTSMYLEDDGSITAVALGRRFMKIRSDGFVLSNIPTLVDLDNINYDSDGNLLGLSSRAHSLYKINQDGSSLPVASGLNRGVDVELSPDGVVHVLDERQGNVQIVNPDNSLSLKYTDLPASKSMGFASDNTLYVLYSNKEVTSFSSDGQRIQLPVNGVQRNRIISLAVKGSDSLYYYVNNDKNVINVNISPEVPGINPGEVVYTTTVDLPTLAPDENKLNLDFGAWTPTDSGDYEVTLTVNDNKTENNLRNLLHVGPNADSFLSLSRSSVLPGDNPIQASLRVTGADSTSVTRINPEGISLAAQSGTRGRAIGADSLGNIYSADTNRIVRITPDGTVEDFVTGITLRNGLVVDSADNIYGGSSNDIIKITPQGAVTVLYSLQGLVFAVALDYNDQLYAADNLNNLYKIHPDGTAELLNVAGLFTPRGLTIDVYGNIYVLNGNHKIIRITPDLTTTLYFEEARFEYEGVNVTADCSNNLLFAPFSSFGVGEEEKIFQLVGDTGEVIEVLFGPSIDPALRDMDVLFYDRIGKRLLIWTDLNNGKIFSFPVICGGIDVEAHIITRDDVDLSSADPAPSSTSDLGNGSIEYIWDFPEVDNAGINVQLNLLFKNLAEGEQRDAFKDAYLTYSNSFDPVNPVQVPIDIPSLLASSELTLSPELNAAQYGPNTDANITVGVTNGNDASFTGTLELSILDQLGNAVIDLPTITIEALTGPGSTQYTSQWNTGVTVTGDYKLSAKLFDTTGRNVESAEVAFTLVPGTPNQGLLSSSVTTDRPVYASFDNVEFSGRVRNITTNAIQDPSVHELMVSSPTGVIIYLDTQAINSLYPNSYSDLPFTMLLTDSPSGIYTVNLVTKDATSGNELVRSTTSFEVARADLQLITGKVTVSQNVIGTGEVSVCNETITNISSAALGDTVFTHLLINTDTGETINSQSQTISLAGNSSNTTEYSVAANDLAAGVYACVLQVELDGVISNLAADSFEVKVDPATRLSATITAQLETVEQGQSQICTDNLVYVGNQTLTAQPIRQLLVNLTTDEVVTSTDSALTIEPGATDQLVRSISTNQLVEGQYSCVIQTQIANEFKTLADAIFTVVVPPINIVSNLQQSDEARLLVLLDGVAQCGKDDDEDDRHDDDSDKKDDDKDSDEKHEDDDDCNNTNSDNDPHGPSNAPSLSEQRIYLEEVLTELGWSHIITTNADDFTRELRTGSYNNYALFSEQVKLDEQVQKELREAIFRGGNLLVAGEHDNRNSKLQTILAVKLEGKLQAPASIAINAVEEYLAGNLVVSLAEKVSRIELRGAEVIATYPGLTSCVNDDDEDDHDKQNGKEEDERDNKSSKDDDDDHEDKNDHQNCNNPAIAVAHNNYGFGHSVYAGFDLLAQAASPSADPLFRQLLIDVLEDTRTDIATVQTGDVVAVKLDLENQGVATLGQAVISLPVGSTVVDSASAIAQTDGKLLWTFTLAEEATESLTFWLQLSDQAGIANIEAALKTGITPTVIDYDNLLLALTVSQSPSIQEVVDELAQLQLQHKAYRKAHEKLLKALEYQAKGKNDKALYQALKASDYLDDVEGPQADVVRRELAFAIRELERSLL